MDCKFCKPHSCLIHFRREKCFFNMENHRSEVSSFSSDNSFSSGDSFLSSSLSELSFEMIQQKKPYREQDKSNCSRSQTEENQSFNDWEPMSSNHITNFPDEEFDWETPPQSPYFGDRINDQRKLMTKFYHPFCLPEITRKMITSPQPNAYQSEIRSYQNLFRQARFNNNRSSEMKEDLEEGNKDEEMYEPKTKAFKVAENHDTDINDMFLKLKSPEALTLSSLFTPSHASTPFNSFNGTFAGKSSSSHHQSPVRLLKRKRDERMNDNKENQPELKVRKVLKGDDSSELLTSSSFQHCEYCKENGEPAVIYNHHSLKDKKGRTLCPVLRLVECPICKTDGDEAHTVKNCPRKLSRPNKAERLTNKSLNHVRVRLRRIKI